MTDITYTYEERTVKKYTSADLDKAIRARRDGKDICTEMLRGHGPSDMYTLVELNELVDLVVASSEYWDGDFHGSSGVKTT
jgi:hypothetical protein